MATGAAGDGFFRSLLEGCITVADTEIQRPLPPQLWLRSPQLDFPPRRRGHSRLLPPPGCDKRVRVQLQQQPGLHLPLLPPWQAAADRRRDAGCGARGVQQGPAVRVRAETDGAAAADNRLAFPMCDAGEDNHHVDEAAERFIVKFYSDLTSPFSWDFV
ncbi:hypothetical protein SASPL_115166 [Salvia splendens]|uniref:Uncharacterized protein n=1 Tax=Salvia splendens TaxID=180675 RepID=A0A8X8Y1Z3_SALSN|nr:hypothetical protein SASPL_115166 [Salvia splendens]